MSRRSVRQLAGVALLAAAAIGAFTVTPWEGGPESEPARALPPFVPQRAPLIGRTPEYQPRPHGRSVREARAVAGLRCSDEEPDRFGVHLEVFANEIDMVIPAGIGVAPPVERDGAYVRGGRCFYPARTMEPTGVIEVEEGRRLTLGQFFDLWGQPLSRKRLVGFRAKKGRTVTAFVNGRRWRGDPRAIPLDRHAAIALQVGGHFPAPARYVFPPGL